MTGETNEERNSPRNSQQCLENAREVWEQGAGCRGQCSPHAEKAGLWGEELHGLHARREPHGWLPTTPASFQRKFSQPRLSSLTLVEGAQCRRTSTGQRWTPSPARHQRAIAPPSCSSHKLHALGQDWRRAAVDGPSCLSFHRAPVPVQAAAVVKWSRKETAVTTHTSFLVSRNPPAKGCPERGTHSLASDSRAL